MSSDHPFSPRNTRRNPLIINQVQALTFTLHGSLPYNLEREIIGGETKFKPRRIDMETLSPQARNRFHDLLDSGCNHASLLHRPDIATCFLNILFMYDKQLYDVIAWCVMPNHVHLILYVKANMSICVQKLKGASAREINKILNATGKRFWSEGYFFRHIRTPEHLQNAVAYLLENPRKNHACDAYTGVISDYRSFEKLITG